MYIVERTTNLVRGFLLTYGPSTIKRQIWDREYASNKWSFAENSADDYVYGYLEKYARKGSILDLGCGSGNTSNELSESAYRSYTGVDISKEALTKARQRSESNGRLNKNHFEC